jgi:hypothetical protein
MTDNNDNNDNNKRVLQLEKIQTEARDLFSIKNKDYGDAFAAYGPVGVLVRIGDKIQRLQSINKSGITLVKDEKIRDTLIDLHNYAAMAIMLLDEPKKQEYNSTIIIAEAGCGQINIDPMAHLPPM